MEALTADSGFNPRKAIIAVFITGIIIVASVGAVFITVEHMGLITSTVQVNGIARGSNATKFHLYIDDAKVDTYTITQTSIYQKFYYFTVDVRANAEHAFKVISSDGEESESVTAYVPFGERTHIALNLERNKVPVIIQGNYTGTRQSEEISLRVNGEFISRVTVSAQNNQYYFTTEVYEKRTHVFEVRTGTFSFSSLNQTSAYVSSTPITIFLDVGDSGTNR